MILGNKILSLVFSQQFVCHIIGDLSQPRCARLAKAFGEHMSQPVQKSSPTKDENPSKKGEFCPFLSDQSPENGQKPLFWLFGSFKNAIL